MGWLRDGSIPLLENGGESARFNSCHRFRNCLPDGITRNQTFMRTTSTQFAMCGTGLMIFLRKKSIFCGVFQLCTTDLHHAFQIMRPARVLKSRFVDFRRFLDSAADVIDSRQSACSSSQSLTASG